MTLQLHESGELSGRRWFRRAAQSAVNYFPNPYYQAAKFAYKRRPKFLREEGLEQNQYGQVLNQIQGTPTYYQFLQDEGLSGNEDQVELSGKFGRWIKTKAVPGIQKLQKNLSPIIGLLPGGGVVNAAFDIINRPKDGSVPGAPVEPVMIPQQTAPAFPQFAPEAPQFAPAPSYAFAPAPMAPGGFNLPFGLDWKTLALIGLGGVVAYKAFKK